jgi:hypothetical protein
MHGDFMYGWRKENTHTKCCQVKVFLGTDSYRLDLIRSMTMLSLGRIHLVNNPKFMEHILLSLARIDMKADTLDNSHVTLTV